MCYGSRTHHGKSEQEPADEPTEEAQGTLWLLELVCARPLTKNALSDHAVICEDTDGHLDEVSENFIRVVEAEGVGVVIVSDEPGGHKGAQEDEDCEEERGRRGDDDLIAGLG